MLDEELREQLAAWARPLEGVVPPDVSVIGRRRRRRTVRRVTGGIGLAAALAAAIAVIGPPLAGRISGHTVPALPETALAAVPYYVSIDASSATVHRTTFGATIATIKPPHGTDLVSVASAGNDHEFVLAAQTASSIRFYRLHLSPAGQPGPLRPARVPPLREHVRGCQVQLAGLAVTPDGRTMAASTLSDCATGNAGPGEIETASLTSGTVLATFRPGNGYPLSLSWTAGGALAYAWSGSQSGVWLIPAATSAGSRPRLLISTSAGLGRYNGAQNPMITPDGSTVIATTGRGTSLEVTEFSARTGQGLRVLIPAAANPPEYCGPLWTDRSGRHLLAACGNDAEASIDNGRLTRLPSRWHLPSYPVPGGPQIAW